VTDEGEHGERGGHDGEGARRQGESETNDLNSKSASESETEVRGTLHP
jgi:hypothetical protein